MGSVARRCISGLSVLSIGVLEGWKSCRGRRMILEWKAKKPLWGAPKIHAKLLEVAGYPSESTVSNVLKRHGLSRPRRQRRRATPSQAPLAHCESPNQVWCADFKGHFYTGDGKRCDPLT